MRNIDSFDNWSKLDLSIIVDSKNIMFDFSEWIDASFIEMDLRIAFFGSIRIMLTELRNTY